MQIPFCGPTYSGRSTNIDPSRSINFFPEVAPTNDNKAQIALIGTPGAHTFLEFSGGSIRLSRVVNGRCFVIAGSALYEVYNNGTYSSAIGTFPTTTGRVASTDNNHQLLLITGNKGYICDTTPVFPTLVEITDGNFPLYPRHAEVVDNYFIVTDESNKFYVSELDNGLVWPPLAFASVVSTPGNIKRAIFTHQQVIFIKEFSSQFWYNAGIPTTSGSPFLPVSGSVFDFGTSAPWSVAGGNGAVFFLANTRTQDGGSPAGIAMLIGGTPQIISPPAINYTISHFSTITDAFGYCYVMDGHSFYVLTFPTEDRTFVFDSTTGLFHEWSSIQSGQYRVHRHLSDTYTYFSGKHIIGHFNEPRLMELSSEFYDEDDTPIASIRIAQPVFDRGELSSKGIIKLVIDIESGVGLTGTQPIGSIYYADGTILADGTGYAGSANDKLPGNSDPMAWLSWSKDGGHTWSNDYPCSMGKKGEYNKRLVWRRLGFARSKIFRLKMVNSVKKVVLGAYINDGVVN